MSEQIGNPPKGTGVDVFSALNGYDKTFNLPRGEGFAFNPALTQRFLLGVTSMRESQPDLGFVLPSREEAWNQWGNDPIYNGDQDKFNASYDEAANIKIALQTQADAIKDSLSLRDPVIEAARQMGMSENKIDSWKLGPQDEFQFGDSRPAGDYDTPQRMLVSKGVYQDPFGAEKPLYKEDFKGFKNGTVLTADYSVDSYGRVVGRPKLKQSMYGDVPTDQQIMSSWNIQSRSENSVVAFANQLASAIWTSPADYFGLTKQLQVGLIDALYGPDEEEVSGSKGLASTYDKLLSGRIPDIWHPEFDGIGGYRELMNELDGGGYDMVRQVEESPTWFMNQARMGDKKAQRAIELHNMVSGTHDVGMSMLDKLSGMYAAKAMTEAYKPSQNSESDPWSIESISGMTGNTFGQLIPGVAISLLSAGTLTFPAFAATATKVAAKKGLKWYGARKAAQLFLAGSKPSVAKAVAGQVSTRVLSKGGQNFARMASIGYTSSYLAGQGYKSALQAGYQPKDAANFALALIPMMVAAEGIGSNYLINRFMSKGSGNVLENMAKELGVDAPLRNQSVSSSFLQGKAFKVASKILEKSKSGYVTASEKLSQSAFGNAAFGFLAEAGQESTEELFNYWGEQWFDHNVGTEAGSVGRFGPEFNLSDRIGLAALGGGIAGGVMGGLLGGRRSSGLDKTIGELVSSGREKEVLSAADKLFQAGSIDEDLHNMIKQEVALVKDYNNKMDLSDPWLLDMLGSGKSGLTSEFNVWNSASRDNQETLENLNKGLADPEITENKKLELEAEKQKVESREAVVQEKIQEFKNGHRVVQKLIEAEAIRENLFKSPEDRSELSGTVESAMKIHGRIKEIGNQLTEAIQTQSLKIQEITGSTDPEIKQKSDKVFKEVRKLGEDLGNAITSGNSKSVEVAIDGIKKHLSGLRKSGVMVSDFDKETLKSARTVVQESLDEIYSKIDNMDNPVGSDEWREEGLKRTTKYKLKDKQDWLGSNADEVIGDMSKLINGIDSLDKLEAEVTAAHGNMISLDEMLDPSSIMDRAVKTFLTTVDGVRSISDIESDLKNLIESGEDMKQAAAEIQDLIAPIQYIIDKRNAVEMLTDILPKVVDNIDTAHSSKVADQGLSMKDGSILGSDLKPYHQYVKEMSGDPAQQSLLRAKNSGVVDSMVKSIENISKMIVSINANGARRSEFLRGIQKARLDHRKSLVINYGVPELGGLSDEDLSSFTKEIDNLDLNDPNDLVKYEKSLERIEEKLHQSVIKSGLPKFFKAVNAKIVKDLYDNRVGLGYFENRVTSSDINPETYARELSPNAKSKRESLVIATVAWSARIGYGPARAREVFTKATSELRSGNATPNIEQEMALIDAHSMAHTAHRKLLLNGLTNKDIEARIVSVFGFAGSGKTSMNPFLIRMDSIHRGSKPKILVVVPGKNNRDKTATLAAKYDLSKFSEVDLKGMEAFEPGFKIDQYDMVVIDEAHALDQDQSLKLYSGIKNDQIVYALGDPYQTAFSKQKTYVPPISDLSIRTLPLSITYRQNNNPYMLFLAWSRGLITDSRIGKIGFNTKYRGFNTEYSLSKMEGVRSMNNSEDLLEHFIESFKPELIGEHVIIVASIEDATKMKGRISKDPRMNGFDPSKFVYHMESGEGSALGAQFRSIFVDIQPSVKNYTKLLYTAASRGTDYAAISNAPEVTSIEVEDVQKTEVDQNEINRSRSEFDSRQKELSSELKSTVKETPNTPPTPTVTDTEPSGTSKKRKPKNTKSITFDMDDLIKGGTNDPPTIDVSMDGRLSKGNVKKWVFGNLLSQGKMALMSGSKANGTPFGTDADSQLETSYRAALVTAVSSGILGQSPTVAMFKQSVNGTTSYEYRLILEEDGVRELKKIARRLKFKGDERTLLFVGRIPVLADVEADNAWRGILKDYISTVHEIGKDLDEGSEVPGSRTSISFSRPGAPILTDPVEGEKFRPTNSLSRLTADLKEDGKIVEGPYVGKNLENSPIPFLLVRHKGLPSSLDTEVWGRMPNVTQSFFDKAIDELKSMNPKKDDPRDFMEKTLAYHYIRFNRSILVVRDRNDKEVGVKEVINKYFKLASDSRSKGPVFKHSKDDNGISNAVDAKKALIETMDSLKKDLSSKDSVTASTFTPFRIINRAGNRIIDPEDAALLEFPVQRVNFPMGIVDDTFTSSRSSGENNDSSSKLEDDGDPIVGFFMSNVTDSDPLALRSFIPALQQEELARRIYGDRFIDGVLEFKPRDRSGLYGLMAHGRINAFFDEDGNIREGVIDHEAMHWIMQNSLDRDTYDSIIEEARERIANEESISDPSLINEVKANEWIAEEYRKNLPPTDLISRVLAFIRKVLMRLKLYRPDIDALFEMASSGTLTKSAEPTNNEENFSDELTMNGESFSEFGEESSLRDDDTEKGSGSRSVNSASEILMQYFPEGIIQVARNMFSNALLDKTEYAPVKNDLSFIKAPFKIKDGSIDNLKKSISQQRLKITGQMKDLVITLNDDSQIFFEELNKENLYEAADAVSRGRYKNPFDINQGDLLNSYVAATIGTDFNMKKGGKPDYAVFNAMVKASIGGVSYQVSENNDYAQKEKSFRQGDSSSDSLNPFGGQSALMKTILMDRPLLYPQRDNQPARPQRSSSESIAPIMVNPKVALNVMSRVMDMIRYQESISPSDPLNIVPSTTEELIPMISAGLMQIYESDKNGAYGIHAFTLMQILTSADPYMLSDGKTKVYSYGRAYNSLLSKQQLGEELSHAESQWMDSLSQTLNNLISPFRSSASMNALRHETIAGQKMNKIASGEPDSFYDTRIIRRFFSSNIDQQVQNEMNRKIKSAWTGRGNGGFKLADMWEYFDITGISDPKADVGFKITRSGDEVVVSSTGRNQLELIRSGSSRNAAFRSLPDAVVNELNPEIRRVYASLYARFFSYAGFPISEQTTYRLLYNVNTKDTGLLADAFGHWAIQVKRGMVALAKIGELHGSKNKKVIDLANLDTSIEDSIAIQKQNANVRSGVYTDNFSEIVSENTEVGENGDEGIEAADIPLPLPSDLFSINKELYMADQYGRGNAFDMQVLNGNGGRSNLQAYTSTLRELMSIDFSKFKDEEEANLFLTKATGDPDIAATIPFGKDVGLQPSMYFGMKSKDGAQGSNLDGMESADVTQAFAYEFMHQLRYMRNGKTTKFTIPSAVIGDRDKNLANLLDFTGGKFSKLVSIRTGKWNKTAKLSQTKYGPPIESIEFNHKLFATEFLIPQFKKFDILRGKSIDRISEGLLFAHSVLQSIGITDGIQSAITELSKVIKSSDNDVRADAVWAAISQAHSSMSPDAKAKFVAALQLPGSPIVLGTDLVINRNGEIAIGSELGFNYSSIFNRYNWNKIKNMGSDALTKWVIETFEEGKDAPGGAMNSYVQKTRRQWLQAKVRLPRSLAYAVNEPTKQYQASKSEWSGVNWAFNEETGNWTDIPIDRQTKIIADAAKAYAYIYMMNDAWTHDLLFGPYGSMAKPNSVSKAGKRRNLYMDNMGRAGTALSSGIQAIPDSSGISRNVNFIMFEDGVWTKGNEIHDGASMTLPHHYEDMNHAQGGPASIASSTSMKTVASFRGRIVKHSQERISPSSYSQSPLQREITNRAYSIHPELEAAWAPIASYDFSDPYKLDLIHFEQLFNEAVAKIRAIRNNPIDGLDPLSGTIGSILGDIASPRSSIKTKQQGIQYTNLYHGEQFPEFVNSPLSVSFSIPSNRLFTQLNAERDLSNMKAPRQTQQHAWMGATRDGYELVKPIDDLWSRYVDDKINKMRKSMGEYLPGSEPSSSQRSRVEKKIRGIVLGSISPENYMGQVMSVLTDENVSLNNPIIASIVRSTLSKALKRDITNPRVHGNLYVSTPGHYFVWEENGDKVGSFRPMNPDEVLMPFSYIESVIPPELRDEARYMTLPQIREIVSEEAMKYASLMYKDQAMADLYISQKNAEFDELLNVYISRTPSNLVSGSSVLKVAGFISDQGNTISVHPDINDLTGSDHDIDQWTVQLYKAVEVIDEVKGARTWSVDRPTEGSGDITLDQMNNLTLDLIREYHASESPTIQNRLKAVITGTKKFTEAYDVLLNDKENGIGFVPSWMQDLGNPAAFAPSVKAVNAGKALVGSFMNASKTWAYIMRSANKASSLGMSLDQFKNLYTPGMPIFKDGETGIELIDENFSALANQSLDDYKTLMAMGSLNITTDNVNVIIGAIASGVPLIEAMSLGRGKVLSGIEDLIGYSNRMTKNKGHRSRHNVYSALQKKRKGDPVFYQENAKEIEKIEQYYFIGSALNMAGAIFSHDSRSSWSSRSAELSDMNAVLDLTGKNIDELLIGSVDKNKAVRSRRLNEQRSEIVARTRQVFNLVELLKEGNAPDGSDLSDVGRRFLKSMVLENDINNAIFLENSKGASKIIDQVISLTGRKGDLNSDGQSAITELLRDASLIRSIESLEKERSGKNPGRVVDLFERQYDLANVRHQALFVHAISEAISQRMQTVSMDQDHPGHSMYLDNLFLSQITTAEGSGLLVMRNANMYKDPIEKESMRNSFSKIDKILSDKNGVQAGDVDSEISTTHSIEEMLSLYSVLNHKLGLSSGSFARFIDPDKLSWVNNGFHEMSSKMADPDNSSISGMTGSEFIKSVLVPAGLRKSKLRNVYSKRESALPGEVYVVTKKVVVELPNGSEVKTSYDTIYRKSNGDESKDVMLGQSTSRAALPFSSTGAGLEENTQVIHPTDKDSFRRIMNGDSNIQVNMKHSLNRGLKNGPAMTPFGPVIVKDVAITKMGIRVTIDASKLSFSHGNYSNSLKTYQQPFPASLPSSIISKLESSNGISATEALEALSKSGNPFIDTLSKALLSRIDNARISSITMGPISAYNNSDGRIWVSDIDMKESPHAVLLHEMIHGYTLSIFAYERHGIKLTDAESRFFSAMSALREDFLGLKNTQAYKDLSDREKRIIDHAGSSVSEFVSNVLAEPEVRDFIANADLSNESIVSGTGTPNLWQRFWRWVFELLNISQENAPFSESMVESVFYSFKEFIHNSPSETISEGLSMREAPIEKVEDIREQSQMFKSGRYIGATEDISAKDLEDMLISNSHHYYKPDKKEFVFQGIPFTVKDPADMVNIIKKKIVPYIKSYDLKEKKSKIVSVLNNGASLKAWGDEFMKVNSRNETKQMYSAQTQNAFLSKIKYDRDPGAFYFLYSDLKDTEHTVTNNFGQKFRIADSGLKFIKGLQGYDPIIKVIPKKNGSGSTISVFDVTSSSFSYNPSDRRTKLFQKYAGKLSNTSMRSNLTSSEGHVRGFMAAITAAASSGSNVTIADIKAIHLTNSSVVSSTVSMFDAMYSLKVMKDKTPFFTMLPENAQTSLNREGIEEVLNQSPSVHAYRSMIEERLEQDGVRGIDEKEIPVSVSIAYKTLIDRIDAFHAKDSQSYLLLREGITDRIRFIKSAKLKQTVDSYSAEEELETLQDMLLEIDGFDKKFALGQRFSETFFAQFKTGHNLSDPMMQQIHAKMVDGQNEVSARAKTFQDRHLKKMKEFTKAIGWTTPDELIGGGWKKYDVLFVRSSTNPNDFGPKIYDENNQLISANTGEIHWNPDDPRTAKLLKEKKLTKAHLEYSKWLVDEIQDMMILQLVHSKRMDTTSEFWKGINFNQAHATEWAKKAVQKQYPRGWMPITMKGLNEAVSGGDFKGAGNAMLRRMENTSRIIDDEIPTPGDLKSGTVGNTFLGELFPELSMSSGSSYVSIGRDNRVSRLGLVQQGNGDYKLVDPHVNKHISHDPEHAMNQFIVSGWRRIVHESKTLPAFEAYLSWEGRQSNQGDSNSSVMKLYADSLIYGRQSGAKLKNKNGMDFTPVANSAYAFNSITRLALNIPVWFGNAMFNTTAAYRTAIANSASSSDLFGVSELNKAMKMTSFDLINEDQRRKIQTLMTAYKVFEMSELDATRNYRRMANDKALWSSHIMHIGNWGGDFQVRAAVMVAQMLKDGSWDAHGVDSNGNMTYDIKKDKRFYKDGKRVANSELIENAIKERLLSEYLTDQKPDEELKRGYDLRMAKIFTFATNKYVIGGMDSLSQTAADNLWYMQLFLQFRRFIPDKVSNAFQSRTSTDLGGHWDVVKENGQDIAKWMPREMIGYFGAMLELVGFAKQVATMPRSEWKSLDSAAKESIARAVSDVFIAIGLILMYKMLSGGFGDDKDKEWWQKNNAFNKRVLYATQDIFAYTPGLLHDNLFKNAIPAADMVVNWWNVIAGDNFEKDVKKVLWNVPGYGSWKSFSDIYTAEEEASKTAAEKKMDREKRAEQRDLEALEAQD